MVPVIHAVCWHVFGKTVWGLSCVSSSEEASSWCGQPFPPIWCRVRRMVWALTGWPPTSSISADFKESIWMWRLARAFSFFGRTTRGLFWVDPALLKRWMILPTVLQLSFRVLAIFLLPCLSSCSATIRLLRFTESFFAMWCQVGTFNDQYERVWELPLQIWNTPAPYAHGPSNTNESHDILEGKMTRSTQFGHLGV